MNHRHDDDDDQPSLFDPTHLARRSDPQTSKDAARSIDLELTALHHHVLDLLRRFGPLSDDELSSVAVQHGLFERHEGARRVIRTLREAHGLIVPFLVEGEQVKHLNQSGRWALCWQVKPADAPQ